MGNAALAVSANGLVKHFGPVVAVDEIDVRVEVGRVPGILGPNGAGKTTLLRMLFGLVRPDSGSLQVFGNTQEESGEGVLDGVAGFVESPRFYPYLSGRRNLQLLAALDGRGDTDRVDEVLDTVSLSDRASDKVGGYSFGMRQRLGVAASLLRSPRLLVLDEPANGLDPAGIRDMRSLITKLAADGLTVLLSSHDMSEVEVVCDSVTILRSGRVVFEGSMSELRQRAPDPAHRLRTSDDHEALIRAKVAPGIRAVPHADDGLAIVAGREYLDAYVIALGRTGIAVRALELEQTPLESLFFLLTEDGGRRADDEAHADLLRVTR